jgi:hypothetical protein
MPAQGKASPPLSQKSIAAAGLALAALNAPMLAMNSLVVMVIPSVAGIMMSLTRRPS